ncbi:hypothetical protein Taro_024231 [Colocasia esculenta]|uniref:Glucan endo-1,3-beta-D-glucosidase n=1 Tax=Colocasia esculenta TaxID=4460 RepID=A0A843VD32_COLES|nr:hypothetical protein [Colocasia esculenta]
MRIYYPGQQILQALRSTNIDLLLDFPGPLRDLAQSPAAASDWVRDNILAYWPNVCFRYVAVGNEVIFDKGWPSTSSRPCATSTSPSPSPACETRSSPGAPLLVNVYPYFSNVGDPENVDLDYAQFTMPDIVVVDGYNDFEYQNLFDAMVDAVYTALERVGAGNVDVVVSETSCPSAGGFTATVENARIYNTWSYRQLLFGIYRRQHYKATASFSLTVASQTYKFTCCFQSGIAKPKIRTSSRSSQDPERGEAVVAYMQLRWRQRQEGGGRLHWRCRQVAGTCERWRRRGQSRRRCCRGGCRTTGVQVALLTEAVLLRRGTTGVKVELQRGAFGNAVIAIFATQAGAYFSPALSGSVTRLVTMLIVGLVGVWRSRYLGLSFLAWPSSDVEWPLFAICGLAGGTRCWFLLD